MTLLDIELAGLPPTANHLYRTARNSRRYKTAEGSRWQRDAAAIMAAAYKGGSPYSGDVTVDITFGTPDRRRWDLDNRLKALLDALQMGGILANDAQIKRLCVARINVSGQARTEIIVDNMISTAFRA